MTHAATEREKERRGDVDAFQAYMKSYFIAAKGGKYMLTVTIEELSVFMTTALIAFYGKMGCLVYASKIFDAMVSKQVCSWNSMISSLALNVREKQALTMYEKMRAKGLQPNEITFVAVLSACARAKLVYFGFKLFEAMPNEFGLVAKMEHYGCVVDLLGRHGLLQEAYDFIKKMPFEADATVLGVLMGACRLHGAIELGNEVAQLLLESQLNHSGRYVHLSRIYAGAERWDHAAALRKAILDAGIHSFI
ncbi:putative pentatricopeptide repeat-containing protein At1g10330 [Solanum dulcamara]|uniref:putative pentatricopeptide repeat-containing protein At1g10330 n=1 Tax=Solanum dulcamara TaxID=45834 RepID=UPI002486AD0E|nr:putative pentatricopeptide repeat-containing protein At1g10330 [Solanum dulcamara]